jgi:hypothetical protein
MSIVLQIALMDNTVYGIVLLPSNNPPCQTLGFLREGRPFFWAARILCLLLHFLRRTITVTVDVHDASLLLGFLVEPFEGSPHPQHTLTRGVDRAALIGSGFA